MKRFWKDVALNDTAGGWSVALDQRPLKTPARETLVVGSRPLGEAIADEWRACGEEIDPRVMPLTGLANAAIDHVAPAPERFAADLAQYAEGDLLCYRAEHPPKLVAAQAAAWDPLLDWAGRRYGVGFETVAGVMHRAQPPRTIERLAAVVCAHDPFRLAALSPLVTVSGSLVVALALAEGEIALDRAWAAATLDEAWQAEQWGDDPLAEAARDERRRDFEAAYRFLTLL